MILKLYNENPSDKVIDQVVKILQSGGVIAYPTDTVYAFGCALSSSKGAEKLRAIKGKKETLIAIVCSDLSNIAEYAKVDDRVFKILRENLPGAFTFILRATSMTPNKVLTNRKTIGIRVPDNNIAIAIVRALGEPILTTSIKDDEVEYMTDPELIRERYHMLECVVDGGIGTFDPSTVVDCSGDEPEIIRQSTAVLQ